MSNEKCSFCGHTYPFPVAYHHADQECAANIKADAEKLVDTSGYTDAERREDALTAFFVSELEIDGNSGKASPREYARFALTHGTNPIDVAEWAKWVPDAEDPLCTVATWADDPDNGRIYVWSARGVEYNVTDATELVNATHPRATDEPMFIMSKGHFGGEHPFIMTLGRNASGKVVYTQDRNAVVTEWVFSL